MAKIDVRDSSFDVEAVLIGNGLGIEPCAVPALMRAGEIRSIFERGEGSDSGRYRLAFFHAGKRFRITIDAAGAILASEQAFEKHQ